MKIVLSRRHSAPNRLKIEDFGYRRPVFPLKIFLKNRLRQGNQGRQYSYKSHVIQHLFNGNSQEKKLYNHWLGGGNVTVEDYQPSADTSAANAKPWGTVATCYSAVDAFFPVCGLFDLTEGIYHGNSETPYEQAEANQFDYLLDQVRCESGRRVLDLGCGYGALLELIRQRNAKGVGITISAEQVRCCRQKNLDVHLIDYRRFQASGTGRSTG